MGPSLSLGSGAAEHLRTREYEELGFTGLALCFDYNALNEFVKDQGTYVVASPIYPHVM
jgi:hypothetical protein